MDRNPSFGSLLLPYSGDHQLPKGDDLGGSCRLKSTYGSAVLSRRGLAEVWPKIVFLQHLNNELCGRVTASLNSEHIQILSKSIPSPSKVIATAGGELS